MGAAVKNIAICPEDTLRILLPAKSIPDQAKVTKRGGEQTFVLRHSLKLFVFADQPAVDIEGFFLVTPNGNINQIKPETELLWSVGADELIDVLQLSWEPEEQ